MSRKLIIFLIGIAMTACALCQAYISSSLSLLARESAMLEDAIRYEESKKDNLQLSLSSQLNLHKLSAYAETNGFQHELNTLVISKDFSFAYNW